MNNFTIYHNPRCSKSRLTLELMKEKGLNDVLLTGGGIIPDKDIKKLNEIGVGKLFPPGTDTKEIIDYITNYVKENRKI